MLNTSLFSVLVHEQAKRYGDKTAMSYRDYEKNVWVPVSWNRFSEVVRKVSASLLALGVDVQENLAVFARMLVRGFRGLRRAGRHDTVLRYQFGEPGGLHGERCRNSLCVCRRTIPIRYRFPQHASLSDASETDYFRFFRGKEPAGHGVGLF